MSISKKNLFFMSLGAGLEYYDFILYGLMALPLSSLFFPSGELALTKTLALFALGYLIRPLGGLVFGMMGDAKGRKSAFIQVMFLMSFATFAIGCLPTYTQIGLFAPGLLLLLRIIQGFSFGAEIPSALSLVGSRPIVTGFLFSSVTLGSLLATLIIALLHFFLTEQEILAWGWRIPFLLGGSLAAVNSLLRRKLPDIKTPVTPLKTPLFLLRAQIPSLLSGVALMIPLSALVLFALTSFPYYPALTIGMVSSTLTLPLAGLLAEHLGTRRLYCFTATFFSLFAFPLFQLLPTSPSLFMILYQTALSLLTASGLSILPTLFPSQARTTAISLCYNITYAFMGCMPALFATHPSFIPHFLIGCLLLGTSSLFLFQRQVVA